MIAYKYTVYSFNLYIHAKLRTHIYIYIYVILYIYGDTVNIWTHFSTSSIFFIFSIGMLNRDFVGFRLLLFRGSMAETHIPPADYLRVEKS